MPGSRSAAYADALRTDQFRVTAVLAFYPQATIAALLARYRSPRHRIRKLDLCVTLWLVIMMSFYANQRLHHVLRHLLHTLRLEYPEPGSVPTDGGIVYRRRQLGVGPLYQLFRQCCHPLATPALPGAFFGAYRVMAVDGTADLLYDSAENRATFGGPQNDKGETRVPQLKAVALVECGTHAIVDAVCLPAQANEHRGLRILLRSIGAGMLVLLDRGLHSYERIAALRARGAHVLGRLPKNVTGKVIRALSDGSVLADLPPGKNSAARKASPLRVRIITYQIAAPAGATAVYRLVTTLLDPVEAPAERLALLYHERWEAEGTFDELKTHQRLANRPFRSQTPQGVVQEFYGLLLAHYAIRAVMQASAAEVGLDPDRISFTHTLRVLQDFLPEFQRATPDTLTQLTRRLHAEIREQLLPDRRDRVNPRAIKRRGSQSYPVRTAQTPPGQKHRPIAELIRLI